MWTAGYANNDGLAPTFSGEVIEALPQESVCSVRWQKNWVSVCGMTSFVKPAQENHHGSGTLTAISGLSGSLIGSARPV
jgi:hypothetical protein